MMTTKKNKGFTLLETLVYIGLLFLILTFVAAFLLWILNIQSKTTALREVANNARFALHLMSNEVREARSIYTPTTSIDQLSLETSQGLPPGEQTTYVDFFLCGTRLCMKREFQNPVALTAQTVEVTNLEFHLVDETGTPAVQVVLELDHANPSGRPELEATSSTTTTASLRFYE